MLKYVKKKKKRKEAPIGLITARSYSSSGIIKAGSAPGSERATDRDTKTDRDVRALEVMSVCVMIKCSRALYAALNEDALMSETVGDFRMTPPVERPLRTPPTLLCSLMEECPQFSRDDR